jgi:hypothetical protein
LYDLELGGNVRVPRARSPVFDGGQIRAPCIRTRRSANCSLPFAWRPAKEILSDKVVEKLGNFRPGGDYGPQDQGGGADKHLIAIVGTKGQLRTVEEIVPRSCRGFNEVHKIAAGECCSGLK